MDQYGREEGILGLSESAPDAARQLEQERETLPSRQPKEIR
jgi:hypothetical protein